MIALLDYHKTTMPLINDFYAFLQFHFMEMRCYLIKVDKITSTLWNIIIHRPGNWAYPEYEIRKKLVDLGFHPLKIYYHRPRFEIHITIEKI